MKWLVRRWVRRWHAYCWVNHDEWRAENPTDSRVSLWLSRAEGASAMLRWIDGDPS